MVVSMRRGARVHTSPRLEKEIRQINYYFSSTSKKLCKLFFDITL